jgi:sugar phosphate isomerase/epimerase
MLNEPIERMPGPRSRLEGSMTPIPISLQLYTVRDLIATDMLGVLRQVADIGYRGVEIGGFGAMTPQAYRAMLADFGLKASAAWSPTPTKENIAGLVETYAPFGIKHFIGGLGPNDMATVEDCKRAAEKFQTGAVIAKEHGFEYGFHNHEWEFKPLADGQLPYDILIAEAPDAFSELDIYWAQFGGADPAALARRYRSRLQVVHVKDGVMAPDRSMTAVGSGKLDMPSILGALDPTVTKWLTVELDACHTDMLQAVRDSYTYLVGSGYGAGNK